MKKSWLVVCFLNFFVAAMMGLILRWMYLDPLPAINFQFLVHGHSHVALLGWTYLAIYCLTIQYFIPKKSQVKPVFNRLFWTTEIAVIGMMVDFPIHGYAILSIFFSTLHIFCSYFFAYLIWKETKEYNTPENKLLHTALFFMLFSTIGVWCLGPAVGVMGKASAFYQIAIQFFLHFQFNGWFLFAILALLLRSSKSTLKKNFFNSFYRYFVIGTLLTFSLPVSWYLTHPILYYLNSFGVAFLFIAMYYFKKMHVEGIQTYFFNNTKLEKKMYQLAFFSLLLKIGLQGILLYPEVSKTIHHIKSFIIGYIHLMMLGIITFFIFVFLSKSHFLQPKVRLEKWGLVFVMIGFCTTEIILLFQGICQFIEYGTLPFYHYLLFSLSIFLPLGIILIATNSILSKITMKIKHC